MKKRTIILLSVLVVAVAATIYYFGSREKTNEVSFATARAHYGYIAKSVTATGAIEPVDTVSVGAQASGVVRSVYVDFNSVVKRGQLLATIDPSIIMAQEQESRANFVNSKSNLQFQQANFNRQNQLFTLGAISQADYQVALNQYNSAEAAVDNSAAQLRAAQKNLYYTNIYSPIDGVVLNRNVSAGQTIASSFNAPTLFIIAKDLRKMHVNADVDEADIGGVQVGQHATFTVDAFPGDTFKGTVEETLLHPSLSANVVTYTTLINVDNKELKLKPGMTASINIYTEEDNNALLIPSRALSFKPDSTLLRFYKIIGATRDTADIGRKNEGPGFRQRDTTSKTSNENEEMRRSYVWVKTGDTLTEKQILTGMNDDSYVNVIKGLSPDDDVITNIATAATKNGGNNTQQSPFMPQMQRRPTGNSRN